MIFHKRSEKNITMLNKLLAKELPQEDLSLVRWRYEEHKEVDFTDDRSWFKKFIQSREFIKETAQYRTNIQFRNGKTASFLIRIGTPKCGTPRYCIGIDIETDSTMKTSDTTIYSCEDRTLDSSTVKDQIANDKMILKSLKRLIIPMYHAMDKMYRYDSAFIIEPHETGSKVIVQTLPQEIRGGFATKFGFKEILTIVDRFDHENN